MLKRKPFHSKKKKAIRTNSTSIEEKELKKQEGERMWELFEQHWNSKPHVCESCGRSLGNNNSLMFHDHLLKKSIYKDLKFEIDNLFLCCSGCHFAKEQGMPWIKHKEAIDRVKLKYLT